MPFEKKEPGSHILDWRALSNPSYVLCPTISIIFVSKSLQNSHVAPNSQGSSIVNSARKVPRILWLQSSVPFNNLNMIEAIVAQHQIAIGKKSGYEVRVVDDFTAYGYLSPNITEIIRKTKHSTQYFIHVR
jgi:hypothetical protein